MERVLDQQGRWRNKVVAFRMSPEEDAVLEAKVRLSGLTKQEYIIRRLTDRVGHESVDITYKYAHLFPSKQQEMAQKLDMERREG